MQATTILLLVGLCGATPTAATPDEAPVLTGHIQLTSRDQFVKAGEAYFNADATWIIFQAVPVPDQDAEPDPFYAMYVAKLTRDAAGAITGIEPPIRVSPEGSANTCGWFHPSRPDVVIFGSTLSRPADEQRSGFNISRDRYTWMFPKEMEIVQARVPALVGRASGDEGIELSTVFARDEYDAECSFSPDARQILYAGVRPDRADRADADLWVFDVERGTHHPLITADGYDGGPFFSPDASWIVYRSDRRGDNHLQLFMAELSHADDIATGVRREIPLTDNPHVNWCPFWHPSGSFVVYATSELGHMNYEVFAIETRPDLPVDARRRVRVTNAPGADVLPAFSPDGSLMMWTAQRGPLAQGETRPSSQLWIARFDPSSLFPAGDTLLPVGE